MGRKRKKEEAEAEARAAQASRNGAAAQEVAEEESSGGGGSLGRLVFLLLLASVLALVLSKDLRSKVLDMLFGAEEEFDYSSTTMPVSEPPVGAPAS